jgi:hypothetical protein
MDGEDLVDPDGFVFKNTKWPLLLGGLVDSGLQARISAWIWLRGRWY